jgi:hypothetical protein
MSLAASELGFSFAPAADGNGWIGSWEPGIGDPSLLGWSTVLAYFVAAWQCARAAGVALPKDDNLRTVIRPKAGEELRSAKRERALWWMLCFGLICLGINKQLDLQSAFTEFGRMLAREQHWYDQRRQLQTLFVLAVGVCGAGLAALLLYVTRRAPFPTRLAVLGAMAVLAFVVIRAASFHHIDGLLRLRWGWISANWLLEMGGILVVAFAARTRQRREPRARAAR